MPFGLPNFNMTVNIWNFPNTPGFAPDHTPLANLAYGRRVNSGNADFPTSGNLLMTLLLPPGTDIRNEAANGVGNRDVVEAPAGTGRFYLVIDVDDSGKGFPNEHRCAILLATPNFGLWPTPIP